MVIHPFPSKIIHLTEQTTVHPQQARPKRGRPPVQKPLARSIPETVPPPPAADEPSPRGPFIPGDDEPVYRKQLEGMTVHELRHYARSVEGLSLFGRQISRANRDDLINELIRTKFPK
jgi:hypothetical protein